MQFDIDCTDGPAFEILHPVVHSAPFVFNSPHSGRSYPRGFLEQSRLDALTIRRSEDCYVDELYAFAPRLGAPLLKANFPRAWLDLNREPYELDPKMFRDSLPSYANTRSVRVAGGLGTVPRLVAEGQEIYTRRLCYAEAEARINGVYKPYHETLRNMIARTHGHFGYAVLIDCHSMPANVRTGDNEKPDFIIGDRFGASAAPELTRTAISILRRMGYTVAVNKPYAGGFITEHYGRPARGLHALQVEVNRGLYMNEATLERTAGYEALREDLAWFCGELMALPDRLFADMRLAAE